MTVIDANNGASSKCHAQPFAMINIFIVYTHKLAIEMASFERDMTDGRKKKERKTGNNNINKMYYSTTSRPLTDAIIISYIFISMRNENVPFILVPFTQRDIYASFPSTLFRVLLLLRTKVDTVRKVKVYHTMKWISTEK